MVLTGMVFGINTSQLIYNASIGAAHVFQINGGSIVSINSSGLYVGSNLLSSTVLGYLNTCTSNIQTQINNKIDITGGTIRSGNLTLTSGNLILGTYSLTKTILNSLITNYASYATQTWVYNQGYLSSVDVTNFLNKNGDTMAGTLNFSTSFALGNIYSRARICL